MKIYIDSSPNQYSSSYIIDFVVYLKTKNGTVILRTWNRPENYPKTTIREKVKEYVDNVSRLLGCEVEWSDDNRVYTFVTRSTVTASSKEEALNYFRSAISLNDIF